MHGQLDLDDIAIPPRAADGRIRGGFRVERNGFAIHTNTEFTCTNPPRMAYMKSEVRGLIELQLEPCARFIRKARRLAQDKAVPNSQL